MAGRLILFISTLFWHSAFSQDTISFSIRFDSLEITVKHSKGYFSTKNVFGLGRTTLFMEYNLEQSSVVSVATKLSGGAPNGAYGDGDTVQTWKMSGENNNSFQWQHEGVEVNIKSGAGTVTNLIYDGENAYELKYYFENRSLSMVSAQDQSRRFMDSILKYDNKMVSFVTTINNPIEHGKKGHNEYLLNDYLVTIDEKTLKRIRGKKVRISGNITYWTGRAGPNKERLFSNTGNEILGGGWARDMKLILRPQIKVLRD